MSTAALESLLKRDRVIVAAALAVVTVLAWIYLFRLASQMSVPSTAMPGMPDMPDMPGMSSAGPALHVWTPLEFLLTFVMWTVMMAGMMIPSASPMVLIYSGVARQAELRGNPLAATGWFAGGYLLSWTAFSLAATVMQALLEKAALLTPMLVASSSRIGGVFLLAAGIY